MRQESNHRMNSGEKESPRISNSRAMGVIILIALLFVFQVTAFVVQKVRIAALERDGVEGSSAGYAARGELFPFNPNYISLDSLQLLGFSPRASARAFTVTGDLICTSSIAPDSFSADFFSSPAKFLLFFFPLSFPFFFREAINSSK